MSPRKYDDKDYVDPYYTEKYKRVRRELWLFPIIGGSITFIAITVVELLF